MSDLFSINCIQYILEQKPISPLHGESSCGLLPFPVVYWGKYEKDFINNLWKNTCRCICILLIDLKAIFTCFFIGKICFIFCRYKKLLSSVDLTKDFFYSYTYPIMQSLQKNVSSTGEEGMPYENMFVWNAFLTRAIRLRCKNTIWTIALVHGHFKQVAYLVFMFSALSCLFTNNLLA